jgi:hypothetical protein
MDASSSAPPIFVGTVVRFRGLQILCPQLGKIEYPRQFIRPQIRDSRLQVRQQVRFRIKNRRAVQIQLIERESPLPAGTTT